MQAALCDGTLSNESIWQKVVLILKGNIRDFWGIVLVEVLWKTMPGLLHRRFTSVIFSHDALHGFQADCGTGTATLEANLIQQLTAMR